MYIMYIYIYTHTYVYPSRRGAGGRAPPRGASRAPQRHINGVASKNKKYNSFGLEG